MTPAQRKEARGRRETELAIKLDREYIRGMQDGWNLGLFERRQQHQDIVNGRIREIAAAKAELKATQ